MSKQTKYYHKSGHIYWSRTNKKWTRNMVTNRPIFCGNWPTVSRVWGKDIFNKNLAKPSHHKQKNRVKYSIGTG